MSNEEVNCHNSVLYILYSIEPTNNRPHVFNILIYIYNLHFSCLCYAGNEICGS